MRGGQLPSILINTDQGATVTISKDGTSRQLVATNGTALFEDVEYGTWNVSSSLEGATTTDTIEVVNEFGLTLPIGKKLSSMPLKTTKLKIGGIKWILFARDHDGYPDGAQTLVSEYSTKLSAFGASTNYGVSTVKDICEGYYKSLLENEKKYVLETHRKVNTGTYVDFNEYIYIPTSVEVGVRNDLEMGTNIGFTSNSERIRYVVGVTSTSYRWWLADVYENASYTINTNGVGTFNTPQTNTIGVCPFMNLSPNTIITAEPDDEGYYTITGAEETTELLLSRALNALSILGVEQ